MRSRAPVAVVVAALLAAPALAHADASWSCSAGAGSAAAPAQAIGGDPCPVAQTAAQGASGLTIDGSARVDGGGASQTTDTRTPLAQLDGKTVEIQNGDGTFKLDAANLSTRVQGSCDANHQAAFASSGSPGTVSLNGRPLDTSHEYSEPGVGANGAPLFGKITIRFGEVTKTASGIRRREIHAIVTDRNGAVVFEGVAGDVSVAANGPVCAPPPVCPPGQQPQSGRCVDVTVAPLPPPPAPSPPQPGAPTAGQPPAPNGTPRKKGCADANALAKQVSSSRIAKAALCLMNVERRRHHLRALRSNAALRSAAAGYAHTMVAGHFFAHGDLLQRILRSGYLGRFANWRIGENLGWGWGSGASPRALVRSWMRSPSHRRNILGRRFRDAGVAAALGSPGRARRGSITYVVDFGGSG